MTRSIPVVPALAMALLLSGSAGLHAALPQQPSSPAAADPIAGHRRLLDSYCVTCHNQRAQTAGLMFDAVDLAEVGEDAEIWEEAIRKLRAGMMPPPGARQPESQAVNSLVAWLEDTLDDAARQNPDAGYVALHRLNRTEYANAVSDILGVEIDPAELLPVDDISDGFDNIANVLKVSPSFLDQYIMAARAVSAQAVGRPTPSEPYSVTLRGNVEGSPHVRGGLPLGTSGGMLAEHFFPADGEYEFRIGGAGSRAVMTLDGAAVFDSADIDPDAPLPPPAVGPYGAGRAGRGGSPPVHVVRLNVSAGLHKVGVAPLASSFAASDRTLQAFVPGGGLGRGSGGVPDVEVTGPFNPTTPIQDTPLRQRLFTCRPSPDGDEAEQLACARDILARVARRAFRREIEERDLVAPLAFFRDGRAGGGFELGIQYGLMAVLSSPKFLYRAEPVPPDLSPGDMFPLGDIELASRLSFFLWSRNPDDELLDLAVARRLSDPDVLDRQVRRMLADPRSSALATNFGFQWLNVGGIADIDPDPVLFPNYNGSLQSAFVTELEMFIGSIVREDRSVVELLDADYTFLNERLASHYGIADIRGDGFRRVDLTDSNRWGLLGKGGILMVTSYPNRTAPVLRGAWILERLLGTPPPVPPPDVEAFPETQVGEQALTVRERLVAHRANPSCNSCHGVMDPLGFALENFDAIGGWRTMDRYARTGIDASGRLVDGTPVNGPSDLRRALTAEPERFVQAMTEKLLMYALGRSVEYYDMPVVRQIVRSAASEDYRMSSIVMGVVNSAPFRMKQVTTAEDAAEVAEAATR